MIIFENFTKAVPVTPEQLKLSELGVQFTVDNTGRCWYDIVNELNKENKDDYKVLIDNDRRVVSWSKDASSIFPVDQSVVVTSKLPAGLANNNGMWKFDASAKAFVPDSSAEENSAIRWKAAELAAVSIEIDTLKDAVEVDEATESEIERLAALKKYRIELNRYDTSGGGTGKRPVKP
ncbi:putative structural protein [Escherichia phage vB_EcoM_fHy-Eco03]|nr:putative structural protein [Escherichia phage vB_EcoM_fHy-Eco03]